MENNKSNNKKLIGIAVAVAIAIAVIVWCVVNADAPGDTLKFGSTMVMFCTVFIIVALGYLLGSVKVKGVSLGTAGVFLVAILFGWLCTIIPADMPLLGKFAVTGGTEQAIVKNLSGPLQNIGLILFVGAVGFIAGPNFFKNLKKNFKTYILLGIVIIASGTLVAVIFTMLTEYGPEFWSGILSGALTSTPGFSAAVDAAAPELKSLITLGHAIAYPFGVIGVVLFVQLLPKFMKADMNKERQLLLIGGENAHEKKTGLFKVDDFGLAAFGLAVVAGLLLGSVTIPLSGAGYDGPCFSLGTTGGVLIMCLVFGHFGRIGKLSLEIPEIALKVFREFGLMLFLLGAGFEGGVALVEEVAAWGGDIVIWGFVGGAVMTIAPMIIGFVLAKFVLKLPLLNNLGSITGGMTSTPALGTLIKVAETDDVASAYAATYPIALIMVVLASQLLIVLL